MQPLICRRCQIATQLQCFLETMYRYPTVSRSSHHPVLVRVCRKCFGYRHNDTLLHNTLNTDILAQYLRKVEVRATFSLWQGQTLWQFFKEKALDAYISTLPQYNRVREVAGQWMELKHVSLHGPQFRHENTRIIRIQKANI